MDIKKVAYIFLLCMAMVQGADQALAANYNGGVGSGWCVDNDSSYTSNWGSPGPYALAFQYDSVGTPTCSYSLIHMYPGQPFSSLGGSNSGATGYFAADLQNYADNTSGICSVSSGYGIQQCSDYVVLNLKDGNNVLLGIYDNGNSSCHYSSDQLCPTAQTQASSGQADFSSYYFETVSSATGYKLYATDPTSSLQQTPNVTFTVQSPIAIGAVSDSATWVSGVMDSTQNISWTDCRISGACPYAKPLDWSTSTPYGYNVSSSTNGGTTWSSLGALSDQTTTYWASNAPSLTSFITPYVSTSTSAKIQVADSNDQNLSGGGADPDQSTYTASTTVTLLPSRLHVFTPSTTTLQASVTTFNDAVTIESESGSTWTWDQNVGGSTTNPVSLGLITCTSSLSSSCGSTCTATGFTGTTTNLAPSVTGSAPNPTAQFTNVIINNSGYYELCATSTNAPSMPSLNSSVFQVTASYTNLVVSNLTNSTATSGSYFNVGDTTPTITWNNSIATTSSVLRISTDQVHWNPTTTGTITNTSGTNYSATWTVPDQISPTVYIQICDSTLTNCYEAPNSFKILPKIVATTSTNNTWAVGDPDSSKNISWTYTGYIGAGNTSGTGVARNLKISYSSTVGGHTYSNTLDSDSGIVSGSYCPSISTNPATATVCTIQWDQALDIINDIAKQAYPADASTQSNLFQDIQAFLLSNGNGANDYSIPVTITVKDLQSNVSVNFLVNVIYYNITWVPLSSDGVSEVTPIEISDTQLTNTIVSGLPVVLKTSYGYENYSNGTYLRLYPYSTYQTDLLQTSTNPVYAEYVDNNWVPSSYQETITVLMKPAAPSAYNVFSNLTYNSSGTGTGTYAINCWMQDPTSSDIVTSYNTTSPADTCSVTLTDATGATVATLTASASSSCTPSPDSGCLDPTSYVFRIPLNVAILNLNNIYYGAVTVTLKGGSTSYYTNTSYNLVEPTMLNNLNNSIGAVNSNLTNTVNAIDTGVTNLNGEVNWTNVTDIKAKTDTINWTDIQSIGAAVGENQTTTLYSQVSQINQDAQTSLPEQIDQVSSRILNRSSSFPAQTVRVLYRVSRSANNPIPGASAPQITVYNPSNGLAISGLNMTADTENGANKIWYYDLSFGVAPLTATGDYTIICNDPTTGSSDSVIMTLLPGNSAVNWDAVSTLATSAQLAPLATNAQLTNAVAPLATSAQLTAGLAPLATSAQLSTGLAPLATSSGEASLVAPLVTTAQLSTGLAPLATSSGEASLVAPLVTSAELTGQLAPLSTSSGVASAVAPLVTTAQLSTQLAPLATSSGIASAVAPLVTTAQLSTGLAPLATSSGEASLVAPLVTTAQLSTQLAPLATSSGIASAVAPLVTTAQLSTGLAPLATSSGEASLVAPLVTTAQLSTQLAPLATSSGMANAVAPLVTTAQLSTGLAPLATSSGMASAVAPLVTTAQLSAGLAPLATSTQLSNAVAPLVTSAQLSIELERGVLSKILNHETTETEGNTITIEFIAVARLSSAAPPNISVQDPFAENTNDFVYPVEPTVMTAGPIVGDREIFTASIQFPYVSATPLDTNPDHTQIDGDYTITVSDLSTGASNSVDSMTISLVPSSTVQNLSSTLTNLNGTLTQISGVNWNSLVALGGSLTPFTTTISTINTNTTTLLNNLGSATDPLSAGTIGALVNATHSNMVTNTQLSNALVPIATSAGMASAVAPLVTSAELTSQLAPLATSAQLTNAVAPLVTTAQLSTGLAPLATSAQLTNAVASLVTSAELTSQLAPLATSAQLTNAVAPLVTTAQLSTGLAPLATSAQLTNAVAPLVTTAQLSTGLAPLATSAQLTNAVAPLVTSAQLTGQLAPLATSAQLTNAVAPLVTSAELTGQLAPLATSSGVVSAVAPLVTSAELTGQLAPLATSSGVAGAVAPLVTSTELTGQLAPLATSSGVASIVAPLVTNAQLTNALAPLATNSSIASAVAPLVTNAQLSSALAPLATSAQLGQLHARILNMPTTVDSGGTVVVSYQTDAGLTGANLPQIAVYDVNNVERFSAVMSEAIPSTVPGTSIYTKAITFSWPNGAFTIVCTEPNAKRSDSVMINVGTSSDLTSIAGTLNTLSTTINTINANVSGIQSIVGTITDTAANNTLFGKISGVNTNVNTIITKWGTYSTTDIMNALTGVQSYLGTPTDSGQMLTVFGKVAQVSGQTGADPSLTTVANQTYTELQNLSTELGTNGKSSDAYDMITQINASVAQLQKSVSGIGHPSDDKIKEITDAVEETRALLRKTLESAGFQGLVQNRNQPPATIQGVQMQVTELKSLVQNVKKSIEEGKAPVVKTWLEKSNQ